MLTLKEQLLLLALHDEKGSVVFSASTALSFGLAGAILMELTQKERVQMEGKNLILIDDRPTGDDILDEALAVIKGIKRLRRPAIWVRSLPTRLKKLKDRLADRMVEKGILRRDEKRALFFIPYHRYPTQDGRQEYNLRERIRSAIASGKQPNEQLAVLISLVLACGLINEVFPKGERREAKKRAKEISQSDVYGRAVSESVQAVQAAVIASVTVCTTTAATSS
jgi:hypothetical protein